MHPDELAINGYVDGALGPDEAAGVERHLEGCAACRELVADLRQIGQAAAALGPTEPPAGVWANLERTIRAEGPPARGTGPSTWPWLAAAAALILATAVGLRVGPLAPKPAAPPAADASDSRATAQSVAAELQQAEQHYQKAISGLEQIANAEQGTLDPRTAATLQKNLAVVDQAISESRAALKTEPTSEPAQQSLLDSFKTKIALLQDTVALINEMRKGNDAGAARIVSGLKPKG